MPATQQIYLYASSSQTNKYIEFETERHSDSPIAVENLSSSIMVARDQVARTSHLEVAAVAARRLRLLGARQIAVENL